MKKTLIERVELTSAASTIVLDAIPDTFAHLYLLLSLRVDTAVTVNNVTVRFNNSSVDEYDERMLRGTGSAAASYSTSTTKLDFFYTVGASAASGTFSSNALLISNYASSSAKSASLDQVTEDNATQAFQTINAIGWGNAAAINEIDIIAQSSGNFVAGSSASLYGVTAGNDGTTTVS